MPSISKLIFSGLILLIISGVALPFFIQWPLNKEMLIIKHVLVVWVVIIGIVISYVFLPQDGNAKIQQAENKVITPKPLTEQNRIDNILQANRDLYPGFIVYKNSTDNTYTVAVSKQDAIAFLPNLIKDGDIVIKKSDLVSPSPHLMTSLNSNLLHAKSIIILPLIFLALIQHKLHS